MASETNSTYISDITQKRLIHDITDLYKNPLTEQGIYYHHDDTNMLKGYAMIIGPPDSLYQNGFYFFELTFPYNYPQQPPLVKYMTNDGKTRFHPNLYRNGKVCLSILNTWKGDGWTSCQNIKSILLTLVSILDDKPLLHEPGINENHIDFEKYNEIILYRNVDFSFLEMASQHSIPAQFIGFIPYIQSHVKICKDKISEIVLKKVVSNPEPYYVCTRMYNLNININWVDTYHNLVQFYKNIS
jgi:ubiquitin-protein ligase